MKPLTLKQIGERLVLTYQKLTPEERSTMTFESVMKLMKIPVGKLPKVKQTV